MEQKYNMVPNIISGKDLDYLSDMFEWNYGALKTTNEALSKVTNEEIKEILKEGVILFEDTMNIILNILKGGANE